MATISTKINTQKNGGYEMEHGYGVKKNVWKNYCRSDCPTRRGH